MGNESANDSSFSYANVCQSIQDEYPDVVDRLSLQVIFGILYSFIMIIGLCGNALVVYSILVKRLSFSVRNIFILSLAMSDIVIALTSLPITAITSFARSWLFGSFFCRVVNLIQGGGIFISSFTLAAIAIDRYFLILHPQQTFVTYSFASGIVVSVWSTGYMVASPALVFSDIHTNILSESPEFNYVCGGFCEEKWPDKIAQKTYGLVVLIVQYAIPLTITLFCYVSIAIRVQKQIQRRCAYGNVLPNMEERLLQRRRRTTRMTTTMVASFMLAWLPINLMNLLRDFEYVTSFYEEFTVLFLCAHVIAMSSIIWNPLIYSQFNDPFRCVIKGVARLECSRIPNHNKHQRLAQVAFQTFNDQTATTL